MINTVQLFQTLTAGGCRLLQDGEQLRIQDPRRMLTDDLRQAIREHKTELLRVLAQMTPAYESLLAEAYALEQSAASDVSSPHVEDIQASPVAWRCPCCKGTQRWRSIYDVLICGTCHPPAAAALVAVWEGAA